MNYQVVKQRIGIARALAKGKLLVLDEPLSALMPLYKHKS